MSTPPIAGTEFATEFKKFLGVQCNSNPSIKSIKL